MDEYTQRFLLRLIAADWTIYIGPRGDVVEITVAPPASQVSFTGVGHTLDQAVEIAAERMADYAAGLRRLVEEDAPHG